jgi:hypothetical protein
MYPVYSRKGINTLQKIIDLEEPVVGDCVEGFREV